MTEQQWGKSLLMFRVAINLKQKNPKFSNSQTWMFPLFLLLLPHFYNAFQLQLLFLVTFLSKQYFYCFKWKCFFPSPLGIFFLMRQDNFELSMQLKLALNPSSSCHWCAHNASFSFQFAHSQDIGHLNFTRFFSPANSINFSHEMRFLDHVICKQK